MQRIQNLFLQYQREVKGIVTDLISTVYFMRGSVQYEHLMNRTRIEREMMKDFISSRLEEESKKNHPVY